MKVNPTKMRAMQRFPEPRSVNVDDPEKNAPIYGDYSLGIEGADYDVECAAWGDNEMPTGVKYEADQPKKKSEDY